MHYAATVFGGYVVSRDYAESSRPGLEKRYKRLVFHAHEFRTFDCLFRTLFVLEIVVEQRCRENHFDIVPGVRVFRGVAHIVYVRTHAKGCIGWQCPRRRGPGKEIKVLFAFDFELRGNGGVFDITVTPGLVQFVRAQSAARCRRIRLYGIAFVKQALVVQLFQQPPHAFDVRSLVCDVGMVGVHPISHHVGQAFPLFGIFHHFLAAGGIVFFNGYGLAYVFLGYAEHFFHAQFHWQPVRVPSCLAFHLEPLHGFVAQEQILYGTGHHMMYARHTVCGGRSFVKDERRMSFACFYTFMEDVVFLPTFLDFLVYRRQIQFLIFSKIFAHFHQLRFNY